MHPCARRLLAAAAPLLLDAACASPRPPTDIAATLDTAAVAARDHLEVGNDAEGVQLLETVLRIDPSHARARELRARVPASVEYLYDHPNLGSNFAKRPPVERPFAQKALLYVPDRMLDLFDILSFDVHAGALAHLNLHFTRALQAGVGARTVGGFGWHDHRSLGLLAQTESGLSLVAAGAQAYAGLLAGSSGILASADGIAGVHAPSDRLYREFRDYWAVGMEFTALVGLEFEFHPVDMVDFFLGWFGVDILNDDFARTRSSRLRDEDVRLIRALSELERSEEELDAYRKSLAPPAGAGEGEPPASGP